MAIEEIEMWRDAKRDFFVIAFTSIILGSIAYLSPSDHWIQFIALPGFIVTTAILLPMSLFFEIHLSRPIVCHKKNGEWVMK